jgi:hypothetical protein
MTRSTLSAAVLLVAVAGLSGCTTSDASYLVKDDNAGIAVVRVPQSDLFQWYYKHEAMEFIRDNNPGFKDSDIISQGPVYAGERIDRPKVGPDGKPLAAPPRSVNTEQEYQIVFKQRIPINKITNGPAPTMSGLPNNGMPMNTIVPAGGVQNVNAPYSSMNTPPPSFGGVQNVNSMPPSQMQQPNSQMIPPPPLQPTMPNSGPGLYSR